jgi:outer membrane receptor protein involved in Fe transport
MNVRAAWSKTVSRPEFRELSPAIYPAPRGLRGVQGNPDLIQTGIDSYDIRWEWFFGPSELVSVSGFYKTIDKPIEKAVLISGSAPLDTFSQNKDAKLQGFEFELRKNLGWLTPYLKNVNFLTNVTYVHSEVTAKLQQLETTRKRALQGQADYVVNAAIEYEHPEWGTLRLLYNTVGPTIEAVQDVTGLPDFITGRRDELDLVYLVKVHPWNVPLNLKFSIENLLNDDYPTTVGDTIQENYRTGVTASFGVSYNY